jgi:TRAP-type transport system periplasmic protein
MNLSRLALATSALLLLTAAQAQNITLKFGHATAENNPRHIAAVKFSEVVAKRTNGRVTVQVGANAEFGDDAAMLKALKGGTLDITANSLGAVSKGVPEYAALGLPFLFSSTARAWQVMDGAVGTELASKSAAKGFVLLGQWDNGIRQVTNNVRPVLKPEDMKGLKMRTPPDPVTVDIMAALGASSQQIKFSELHGALQAGVVDGQENPLVNIDAGKLYEVQKFVSLTATSTRPPRC